MNIDTSVENKKKLQDEHGQLIKKVFALRFVTKTLLDSKTKDEFVLRALKILRVQEFLYLNNNKNDFLLNLEDVCKDVNLPYTSQKVIREQLVKELVHRLTSLQAYIKKMENDLPNIFEENAEISELIELEAVRRKCYQDLVDEQNKQLKLLDSVMSLKLGDGTVQKLEILRAEIQVDQTKAELMCSYIINDMLTRTAHSLNAFKTVQGFIDKKLDEGDEGKEMEKK